MKHTLNPADFRAQSPAELLGTAGRIAAAVMTHAAEIRHDPGAILKVLFYGPPGTGKTTIANMVATWQKNNCYGSLFGGWKVKILNEADLVPMAAQDVMLTYMDELAPRTAVIGTSNEDVATLSTRFKSRFQCIRVAPPTGRQIANWLRKKFRVARQGADWIAETCCGNVRQALLDASSLTITGCLPEKIEPQTPKCASRSEAALRAWDTMRQRKAVAV